MIESPTKKHEGSRRAIPPFVKLRATSWVIFEDYEVRIFKTRAYARAGLIGNPSDGYHGKTISIIVKNFAAEVGIYEWPELEIVPARRDQCRFESLAHLLRDVQLNGYYGGLRLVKAAIKRFSDYCEKNKIRRN